MLMALPLLQEMMQDWAQQTDDFQLCTATLKSLEDLHSMLTEAQLDKNHSLYTLAERFVEKFLTS